MKLLESVKNWVLDAIQTSNSHLPEDLYKSCNRTLQVDRKTFRKAIATLVDQGDLKYVYRYGHSFLEASFDRPVHVSAHVVITPPRISFHCESQIKVIRIAPGISFGIGDHPSTILALRMIDTVFYEPEFKQRLWPQRALDIGTGSGILAIGLSLMGVQSVIGIDTDACALYEAQANVRLNQLDDRIRIGSDPIESIVEKVSLIAANLRYPTLYALFPQIHRILESDGKVVFSGIKQDEVDSLLSVYTQNSFVCNKIDRLRDWSAILLTKV